MKETNSKRLYYCRIPSLWHSGKGKTMENFQTSGKICCCQELGWGEGCIDKAQRIFKTVKIFHIIMDTCYYTFVQTYRMYNTKSEPWGKLWTLLILMRQCRFISDNKCTTLVGMSIRGETMHAQRNTWEIILPSSEFCF